MSAAEYLQELLDERDRLDSNHSSHSIRLIDDEIEKVKKENGGTSSDNHKQFGPFKEEIVKLVETIYLPIEEYPKFNFVGKIIGPKGNTLKNIVALTRTKISVLGQGSTRDREKEDELSKSGDPKHEHFKEPLHVIIQVEAPRSDAHERLANAIEEINKCMAPENVDVRHDMQFAMADALNHKFVSAHHGMPNSIIKVGIPPPGAIILNEQSVRERSRSTGGRGGNRYHVL